MARGRFISNEIARDKKVNSLSDDTSRLAFTWLITFADAEGRTYGDPALVRSMIFPRRVDVTVEQMERYIKEWQEAGLIVWYEAEDDLYIYFPQFEKHQVGLRKDREPSTSIPEPPREQQEEEAEDEQEQPEDIQQDDGNMPDNFRQSSGENRVNVNDKLSEDGGAKTAPKRRSTRKKPAKDTRTAHPAIQAIFKITGRYPNKDQYDVLIGTVGDFPDEDKLLRCWQEWRAERNDKKPFSPVNYGWIVDWYARGIPKAGGNNGYTPA
jgi:hypothetical protein